ncbi:2OG-Fe dioxygenase family protein [Pseudomonas sp. NyZ704]|nr:2OG-Fe dioxygenase family protein [Pseudomonas sp. NyZ704]
MNTVEIEKSSIRLDSKVAESCAAALKDKGWVFVPGQQWKNSFSLSLGQWSGFAAYWDNLMLDTHMGDNGRYRYRRYSSFQVTPSTGQILPNPHEPYMQPKSVNPLNGDTKRYYSPLEQGLVTHPFFESLLLGLGQIYAQASGKNEEWNVKLHPYRIRADQSSPGMPTPEGLHRDGVDFIAMMLVDRVGVEGGVTTITDNNRSFLFSKTMTSPMDIILGDDHRVMHEVSAVNSPVLSGYRDALVIAFARATLHE